MAHTPRPWEARQAINGFGDKIPGYWHIVAQNGVNVADVFGLTGERDEDGEDVYIPEKEAAEDARLIAESPRLLEALKRLRAASLCDICYEDKCDPWLCDCRCHAEIGEANEQADLAIAAVEGK